MGTLELILVRHPETDPSFKGVCYGHLDVPLSEKGAGAITSLTDQLASLNPDAVWTSDLSRCALPAASLAQKLGLEPRLSPNFRELDFGEWEGQTWSQIEATDGERISAWMANFVEIAPPGG